ncbi:helix-turn-helix domain-containing protein [Acidocella sp.]|uniref:helix-turn-helix domain-containing protein n=1 Tax=Acidocella sp. TaxID=50710 RepID=UPI003CFC7D53
MSPLFASSPPELVDFTGISSLSKNIEIVKRLTYGSIAFGFYRHRSNDGTLIGTIQHSVLINEDVPFDLDWRPNGISKIQKTEIYTGIIQIHPSDVLIYKRWNRPSRMLFFAIDQSFVRRTLEDIFGNSSIQLKPNIGIQDQVIAGMAESWREELRQNGAGGLVYAEALATALVVHLSRTYGANHAEPPHFSGGMNAVRLNRVAQYIEDHLAEDMSLLTLAQVADFSVYHFKEVFKAETGKAPHQYLIERRIHHAKEMLLADDLPIVQIALAVGFSSQSHFTLNFRKLTGQTPLRFRQESRHGSNDTPLEE